MGHRLKLFMIVAKEVLGSVISLALNLCSIIILWARYYDCVDTRSAASSSFEFGRQDATGIEKMALQLTECKGVPIEHMSRAASVATGVFVAARVVQALVSALMWRPGDPSGFCCGDCCPRLSCFLWTLLTLGLYETSRVFRAGGVDEAHQILVVYRLKLVDMVYSSVMIAVNAAVFVADMASTRADEWSVWMDNPLLVATAAYNLYSAADGLTVFALFTDFSAWTLDDNPVDVMNKGFFAWIHPGIWVLGQFLLTSYSTLMVYVFVTLHLSFHPSLDDGRLAFLVLVGRWVWQLVLLLVSLGCGNSDQRWYHCLWQALVSSLAFFPWKVLQWGMWLDLLGATVFAVVGNAVLMARNEHIEIGAEKYYLTSELNIAAIVCGCIHPLVVIVMHWRMRNSSGKYAISG